MSVVATSEHNSVALAVAGLCPQERAWLRQSHIVVLTNYLRRLHVDVLEQVQSQVGKLTVLVSTPMEPDRQWEPHWGSLNVVVQKNWTLVRKWRHSRGFQEDNFIHIPYDTRSQLQRLRPDAVVAFELGFRTLFSSVFTGGKLPLVSIGNMSEQIERERGMGRRLLRKWLRSRVDCFTFNGPSCRRYLESLGVTAEKLQPFPYFYDVNKASRDEKRFTGPLPQRLLFSGNLTPRKGIEPMLTALADWAEAHPDRSLALRVCGAGPEESRFRSGLPRNVELDLRGQCDEGQLAEAYTWADICLFPTLADEWGLVPIEAFASGCPVVGSRAAQSMEVYGREGLNGWFYEADEPNGLAHAIDRALATGKEQLERMSQVCRETVAGITAGDCAAKFCQAVLTARKNFKSRYAVGK